MELPGKVQGLFAVANAFLGGLVTGLGGQLKQDFASLLSRNRFQLLFQFPDSLVDFTCRRGGNGNQENYYQNNGLLSHPHAYVIISLL
jgi:hypothetical protein